MTRYGHITEIWPKPPVTLAERLALIDRHLELMVDFYGQERGLINFRKHVVKYLRGLPDSAKLKPQLLACTSSKEFVALMNGYAKRETDE